MNAKLKFLLIIILLPFVFGSCASTQKRQLNQASILSRAVNDSIKVGRFDRAKEFSDQLIKLTPPVKSKDKIKITEFKTVKVVVIKKGIFTKEELTPDKKFIVLPEGFDNLNVVVKNDTKFKEIIKNNPALRKEEIKTDKIVKKSEEIVDKILIDKEAELQKARGQNKSWFGGVFQFFKSFLGLGLVGTVVGIIAIAFFAPQLLPLVFSFLGFIVKWLVDLLGGLFSGIVGLFKK